MGRKMVGANSSIGSDSSFEGVLRIDGSLRIDGEFQGDLEVGDALVIGEQGKVKTNIISKRVIVGGIFVGNIEASEEVVLLGTGKVVGNIRTANLVVEKGVVALGKIQINSRSENMENIPQHSSHSFLSNEDVQVPLLSSVDENKMELK